MLIREYLGPNICENEGREAGLGREGEKLNCNPVQMKASTETIGSSGAGYSDLG